MGFQLADIANMGQFMRHAQEHKEQFGHNFFQYVVLHYVDAQKHTQRHDNQHENLPFHHLSIDSHQVKIADIIELKAITTSPFESFQFGFPWNEFYSFITYFSLLQPPQ